MYKVAWQQSFSRNAYPVLLVENNSREKKTEYSISVEAVRAEGGAKPLMFAR